MDDPLNGPRLKIERANAHIHEINSRINAFLDSNPYTVRVNLDPIKNVDVVTIWLRESVPAGISIVCGEVLYQIRSALDHAAASVAARDQFSLLDRTAFPIEETREKLEATLRKRKVEQRLPLLAATIREFKPYKGGNDLLWWLHRLNGAEKHKDLVLVVVANAVISQEFRTTATDGSSSYRGSFAIQLPNEWKRVDKEAILMTFPAGTELQGKPEVTMNIILADIEASEPYSVVNTLHQMSNLAGRIIDLFDERFFK